MNNFERKTAFGGFIALVLMIFSFQTANARDLKPEEIIAKHLASTGTKEKLDSVKTKFVMGVSEFESKLPSKKTNGKMIIVSEGKNLFYVSGFNSKEYPFEKIGYFSDKVSLPFVNAGARSPLGAFIADHNAILSEGLFTGNISTTWSLLDSKFDKNRFESAGTKKIDGKKYYVLNYYPKKTGSIDFTIKLFFDAENFRHTRTEYYHLINPQQDTFGTLGRQAGVKMQMTEEFGDFKTVDGLTLPYFYKIDYQTESNSGVSEFFWTFKISEYRINQKLDANFFKFED